MVTHLQFNLCLYSLEGGDYGPIQYGNAVKQPVLIIDCFGAPQWFKTRDCLDNLCVAMSRNINVELLSGNVYTLAVRPDMTIGELKEEVKAFNPSEDEITRILSTVEFVLHGEKLNDLQMTVSDSILDSANVQVIFYVKPAIECVNAFRHSVKELRDVRIPSTKITSIQPYAFQHCKYLLRLVIPESVTWIEQFAFEGCSSLTSLTIPESVTQIGPYAFSGCSSLKSLKLPESVTRIGDRAFRDCTSLTSLTIPESVTQIGDSAFAGCASLTSLTIPESVTQIGDSAFAGCASLTSLTIPHSVRKIGKNVVQGCSSLRNSRNVSPDLAAKASPSKRRRRWDTAWTNVTEWLTDENAWEKEMVLSSAGVEIAE